MFISIIVCFFVKYIISSLILKKLYKTSWFNLLCTDILFLCGDFWKAVSFKHKYFLEFIALYVWSNVLLHGAALILESPRILSVRVILQARYQKFSINITYYLCLLSLHCNRSIPHIPRHMVIKFTICKSYENICIPQ